MCLYVPSPPTWTTKPVNYLASLRRLCLYSYTLLGVGANVSLIKNKAIASLYFKISRTLLPSTVGWKKQGEHYPAANLISNT